MKPTLTMCAVAILVIGVSLPASAIPVAASAQGQAPRVTLAPAVAPQAFTASSSVVAAPLGRDAFGVEQLVQAAAPASTFSGSYAGAFAGFLTMWPANAPVNDGFGYRDGGEFHGGIDIMAGYGTTIVAASPGVVIEVSQDSGWGQYVKIDHGSGVATLYAHMISGSPMVSPGQVVDAGTPIGLVGQTGYASVAHLHFETYVNGSRVDPYGLLP